MKTLSKWSRRDYGDIYEDPKKLEASIRVLEENSINDDNSINMSDLSKVRVEYTKYLKIQDNITRQKSRVKWI